MKLSALGLFLCLALVPGAAHSDQPRIAIIIDDVGFQWSLDQRALALDSPVALAIIPESPHAMAVSERAALQKREVWVHLPMAGLQHDNCQAGLTCLGSDWSPEVMRDHLLNQLSMVPGAIGINNHQGSRFTADPEAVARFVDAVARLNQARLHPLIIMDSRTVPNSHLERLARGGGLKTLRRRVFLDHSDDPVAILEAWRRLIELAHHHGDVIAIGHSRATTLSFLELAIGELVAEGIELVPPSAMVEPPGRAVSAPLAP